MIFNSYINIEEFNSSSDKTILDQIYNLNQCNTTEVGSLDSYNDLIGLLDKSSVNYFLFNGDEVIGFIVCFRENATYKSKNYKFFSSIKDQFLYIDRVVIKSSYREKGIGTNLYNFVEKIAKKNDISLCCEVNTKPENIPSIQFHKKFGFEEIGKYNFDDHSVAYFIK